MKLVICMPYRDNSSSRAQFAIMAAIVQGQGWLMQQVPLQIALLSHYRSHVHIARHQLGQEALSHNPDAVLWFDDDALPPMDLIPRLWGHLTDYDITVPFFTTRDDPPQSVTYLLARGEPDEVGGIGKLKKTTRIEAIDPPQQIGITGLHVALMRGTALKATYDASGGNPFRMTNSTSEDTCFFQVAYLAGLKVFCDTTVRVGHVGEKVYGEVK